MQKQKKIPQRTCIACREAQDKKNLLRIVKTPAGEFLPDESGKLSGRGAYVCKKQECVLKMTKAKLLHKAFSMEVDAEVYKKIEEAALGKQ